MRLKIYFLLIVLIFSGMQNASELLAQKNLMVTLGKLSDEFETISEVVSPAIVQILATGYAPSGRGSSGVLTKQRSTGSGVILDPDGYIVTNAHVVDGARRVQVVLALPETEKKRRHSILKPRGKVVGAQIVGIDRETDLAVLKIAEKNLIYLKLGNSENVRKGQIVLAFGSPFGLENSVTMGVVSSIARQLESEGPMIYIQTDAPINPGNSGGPLVDTNGQVIGINTLIFSQSGGSEGIGFAAPSNIVENVFKQIRETGRVRRGEIGASVQTVTPILASGLGLPEDAYVIVGDVKPYSPADKAGLRVRDIILKLDEKRVENARQFDVNLYRRAIGDHVVIEIQRGTVIKKIKVAVIERPDDPDRFAEMVTPEKNLIQKLGILGIDLDETIAKMLPPLRINSGIVVANYPSLSYENEGFQPGDVIHSINDQRVDSLDDLRSLTESLSTYDAVVVQVERRGAFRYIAFEME